MICPIVPTKPKTHDLQGRLTALRSALEHWDPDLAEHGQRTAELALQLGSLLRPDPPWAGVLGWGARLHDIGKMALPRAILDKAGPLTTDEWQIMRSHPVHSFGMLYRMQIPAEFLQVVLFHHERFDGTGYPVGLRGEDIPLGARILAVADVYSALTSRRSYRESYPPPQAVAMMMGKMACAFDPEILSALVIVMKGAYETCLS
jgi:HD-GYP domain-containing protein (c-di-GMP phosphodiesterase class II)